MLHLFARVQSIQLRHCNIDDHDIGLEFGRHLQQCTPIPNNRDHLKLRLEQILAGLGQQDVVICNQQPSSLVTFHSHTLPTNPELIAGPRSK